MKRITVIFLICCVISGCEVAEQSAVLYDTPVFTAVMEEQSGTKVYIDSDLQLHWDAGDGISVFTDTGNKKYSFNGQTGDTQGTFSEVQGSSSGTPFDVPTNYAVYPYDASTVMTEDGKIKLVLPSSQSYCEGSFGHESNMMVAVTSGPADYMLPFRNLCGYLVVKLYGDGAVKSVSIKGNNGEKLAGPATVTVSSDESPSVEFGEGATGTITIDCGEGIQLDPDEEDAREFWFCIPPVNFTKGFTVTARNTDSITFEINTAQNRTLDRNSKVAMAGKKAIFKKSMPPAEKGYIETGVYRNYFKELGISQEAIDKKIADTYSEIFENSERGAYKDVEVNGQKMGYVSDVKNGDVRSEGMSYGMMVAVQLDKPELFNKIWRWANYYMRHNDSKQANYGLFAWHRNTNGGSVWWDEGSASDGELYFVTTLLLASRRWGNDGEINYLKEAQTLLDQLFSKNGTGGVYNIINMTYKLINFCPSSGANDYTDPSYHLPAFFEIWAETAADGREDTYREIAANTREYLHKATNAVTGLNPERSNFDGSLKGSGTDVGFHYDSWRVPMNIAMDFTWYHKDAEWQSDYANRIVNTIIGKYGLYDFPDQFALDGGKPSSIMQAGNTFPATLRHSIGFVGALASTSLMIDGEYSQDLVRHMFDMVLEPYPDGFYDVYYDGFLYLFALLHLSGNYRMSWN